MTAPPTGGDSVLPPTSPPTSPPTELLTVADVAVFLRTTPNAVRIMICRGTLPGVVHIGRRVLVRRDDLRRHVGLLSPGPLNDSAPARRT